MRSDTRAKVIDGVLRTLVDSASLGAVITLPGLLVGLDKPLAMFDRKMSKRAKERELRKTLYYMKRHDMLVSNNYEHGITITNKGKKRLRKSDFENLRIKNPAKWDGRWRLVIFDIPEKYKMGRNALSRKLRDLGFLPLQRSVWVFPFPCHEEIETVCLYYDLASYVTFVETFHIDKPNILRERFAKLLK